MVDGEDADTRIRTSIEEREEFIDRLRSALKVGYWFSVDISYGK